MPKHAKQTRNANMANLLAGVPASYVKDLLRVQHEADRAVYQCQQCSETYVARGAPDL